MIVCASFFPSVEFPGGGSASLWRLVFSGHPDVSHHIAAGKVRISQPSGFLCRSGVVLKMLSDQPTVWAD